MTTRPLIVTATLAAILTGFTGCSRHLARESVEVMPERPRETVQIFGRQGERVPWAVMLETVSTADVIVIGESHGHPLGLAAAASLWDDLLADHPDAALLMEFFERDTQVALDDYLSDITDDEAFRKAARRTPGNYPLGHSAMVDAAKAAGVPVFAANAPRRYVRKTTADNFDTLTALGPEQRRLFTVPGQLIEGKYRDDFFEIMGGMSHGEESEGSGMPEGMVEKFYRSQQVWDATMADSVVRAIEAGHRPAILVVGRFHSDNDGGTVQFIRQGHPGLTIRTLSMVTSDEADIDEEDIGGADFVLYVGEMPSDE